VPANNCMLKNKTFTSKNKDHVVMLHSLHRVWFFLRMNHDLCTIKRKKAHSFLQSAQACGQENSSYKVCEQIQGELMICSVQEHLKKQCHLVLSRILAKSWQQN